VSKVMQPIGAGGSYADVSTQPHRKLTGGEAVSSRQPQHSADRRLSQGIRHTVFIEFWCRYARGTKSAGLVSAGSSGSAMDG